MKVIFCQGLFQFCKPRGSKDDIYSPLGPNSIYALTIGSDIARAKRHRAPKQM